MVEVPSTQMLVEICNIPYQISQNRIEKFKFANFIKDKNSGFIKTGHQS